MSSLNISTTGSPTSTLLSPAFSTSVLQNGFGFRNTTTSAMATRNVTNNDENDTNRGFSRLSPSTDFGPQINFTLWLLTALSSAFLALRVYCKFLRHRGLWWDDHLLIGSWLALVAHCAFISACINLGFGRPLTQFDPSNLGTFLLYSNLAGSFSILAALWSKTSFAVTVLRISSGWIKALVWFIIITVNACLGVAIAITWAQCTPIEKVWHPWVDGECWPKGLQIKYNIFTAVYSGAMDIVLAIVPWKIIRILTMNKREKVGVMVAMSMGVFAGLTSLIKVTQLPSISNSTFTESTTQLVILAAAESAITIIAASIPILRALVRDSRPVPGPARFYHSLGSTTITSTQFAGGVGEFGGVGGGMGGGGLGGSAGMGMAGRDDILVGGGSVYEGTVNSRGTGRSSTVITSAGGHRRGQSRSSNWSRSASRSRGHSRSRSHSHSRSRGHSRSTTNASATSSSGWSKEMQVPSRIGSSVGRLSGLSRFSGLSMLVFGASERRGALTEKVGSRGERGSRRSSVSMDLPSPTPPPGKIVQTEEVVVEYEERRSSGQGLEQAQWAGIGRAV